MSFSGCCCCCLVAAAVVDVAEAADAEELAPAGVLMGGAVLPLAFPTPRGGIAVVLYLCRAVRIPSFLQLHGPLYLAFLQQIPPFLGSTTQKQKQKHRQ